MADGVLVFAIDNAGPNADGSYNVVATDYCDEIQVRENVDSTQWATADMQMKMPPNAANFGKVGQGETASFTPLGLGSTIFSPNQVVGTIKTRTGSINVRQLQIKHAR